MSTGNNRQLTFAALVLCGLSLLLITALTGLHDSVPDVLNLIAIGSLTGGASLAVPGGIAVPSSPAPAPAQQRSAAPASQQYSAPPAQRVAPSGPASSTPVGAP